MTNPAQDDLEARITALLGNASHETTEIHQEPPADAPPPADETAAPGEHHAEAEPPPAELESAESQHEDTPVFALVTAPVEEPAAFEPPPALEAADPVIALPPPEEPATDIVETPSAEHTVIDLSPVAAAMAATAAQFGAPHTAPDETPALAEAAPPQHDEPPAAETVEAEPVALIEAAPAAPVAVVAEPVAAEPVVAPRAPTAGVIARTIALMSLLLPYSLVALALRLVMARLFFLHGQAKIEGPSYLLSSQDLIGWPGVHWVITLPMTVTNATLQAFEKMPNLPIPSWIASPLVTYAEFILPICLVLGLATRFAALAFLIMTAVIAVFVAPETWWSTQVYWAAILLVLMSRGPGVVSIDAIIRHFHRK